MHTQVGTLRQAFAQAQCCEDGTCTMPSSLAVTSDVCSSSAACANIGARNLDALECREEARLRNATSYAEGPNTYIYLHADKFLPEVNELDGGPVLRSLLRDRRPVVLWLRKGVSVGLLLPLQSCPPVAEGRDPFAAVTRPRATARACSRSPRGSRRP